MIRALKNGFRVWEEEKSYLTMISVIFVLLSLAYCLYLSMDMMMLKTDIMTLMNDNPIEAINMMINACSIYVAYTIYQYNRNTRVKSHYIALGLVGIALVCFLNYFGLLLLIIYVARFIGFKNIKRTFKNAAPGVDLKVLLPAVLVCFIAVITLFLRFQLGLLF